MLFPFLACSLLYDANNTGRPRKTPEISAVVITMTATDVAWYLLILWDGYTTKRALNNSITNAQVAKNGRT